MPAFEKDRASRRFYKLSSEPFPTSPGGMPAGSMLIDTDTGERFIYDGEKRAWLRFVGQEDLLYVLEDMQRTQEDMLLELKKIKLGQTILSDTDLDEEVA